MKRIRFCIAMFLLAAICLVTLSACSTLGISTLSDVPYHNDEYFPKEGAWYCDELQMQISFDKNNESFYFIDNTKIPISAHIDRDVNILMISCGQPDCTYCEYRSFVATLKFVELSETQLVLEDCSAIPEVVYIIFERIN